MIVKRMVSIAFIFISVFICFINISFAAQTNNTDTDIISRADESFSKKDYNNAAKILQEYIDQNPVIKNEVIYQKLSDIYDHYTFDFEKAVSVYKKYLSNFPSGQYREAFQKALDTLLMNTSDWDSIGLYRSIMLNIDSRSFSENSLLMNNLIDKYPKSVVIPDVYYWMAQEHYSRTDYNKAASFCESYLETFPVNNKTDSEKSLALMLYSQILQERHQYTKAISALDEVMKMGNPNQYLNYDLKVSSIKTHYKLWITFVIAIIFILIIILLIVFVRPWKEPGFSIRLSDFLIQFLITTLATMGPMLLANHMHHGLLSVFPGLLVSGMAALFLIKLLAPIAQRLNKALYYMICLALIAAVSFSVIYFTKSSSILWTFL